MATLQHHPLPHLPGHRPLLPRTLRRREAGWDSTVFSTTLVAFHVPSDRPARWVHVNVVHYNIDNGQTMVSWRQFWEDRAETAFVTLPNGRKFLVLVPSDRDAYQISESIEESLGFRWRGELLILACGINNGLLVNMRTWQEDRARAWEVVSRYITGDIDGNESTVYSDSEADTDSDAGDEAEPLSPISSDQDTGIIDVWEDQQV